MKKHLIFVLLIFSLSAAGAQSLHGTWRLMAYGHIPSKTVNQVKQLPGKYVIVKFNYDENTGKGTISGKCGPNNVSGKFTTTIDYRFKVQEFKASKGSDPYKFSQNFHRAMNLGKNYKIHNDTILQIYFNNNFEFALLKRLKANKFIYYNEKVCNNPWETGENDSITKRNIISYLNNRHTLLSPENIKFKKGSDLKTDCDKCRCGTGRKIVIRVNEVDFYEMTEDDFSGFLIL